MKNILLLLFILFCCQISFSQNLVPNSSFEDTVSCPDNLGQVDRAIGWSSYRGTPDYFNSCSVNGGYSGVPQNMFDFQYPRTGNAYDGLFIRRTITLNAREFIGIQLNQPLTIGQMYFASFFVCRVGIISSQHKNIAANKIGLKLSTVPYSLLSPAPIDNLSQVYTDSIIIDTLNWTEISGFFTSDSSYNYLCIGNFFQDSLTSYISFDSSANSSYYFIDDVTLKDSIPLGIIANDHIPSINIFPNPTTGKIIIEGDKSNYYLKIYDVIGKLLIENIIPTTRFEFDLSKFSCGIYFLIVGDTKNQIHKMIVKN